MKGAEFLSDLCNLRRLYICGRGVDIIGGDRDLQIGGDLQILFNIGGDRGVYSLAPGAHKIMHHSSSQIIYSLLRALSDHTIFWFTHSTCYSNA